MALGPVARSGSHYTSHMNESRSGPPVPLMPATGTLVAGIGGAVWLSADGEIATLSLAEAAQRARREPPLVCHAPTIARRLGGVEFAAYDVLELFAFAKPAEFCAPTPAGLAEALGLKRPHDRTAEAVMVRAAAAALLALLAATPDEGARAIAATMSNAGWGWGPPVLDELGDRTARDESRAIVRLKFREIGGGEFLVAACGGSLDAHALSDTGIAFAHKHYAAFDSFVCAAIDAPVEDKWATYDRVAPWLTARYMGRRPRRRFEWRPWKWRK